MTPSEFVQRARSALTRPTLYWLGKGGWLRAERDPSVRQQPGRAVDLQRELAALAVERPQVHAAYLQGLEAAGLTMASLPGLACDCSGFVCWALGVARNSAPWGEGWLSTDTIHADALGERALFEPAEAAALGSLLVFPKPAGQGPQGPPGHIGIVTALAPDGRVQAVLHCAPGNYILQPPPGLLRNAIAETGTALFDEQPLTRAVNWRGFTR